MYCELYLIHILISWTVCTDYIMERGKRGCSQDLLRSRARMRNEEELTQVYVIFHGKQLS